MELKLDDSEWLELYDLLARENVLYDLRDRMRDQILEMMVELRKHQFDEWCYRKHEEINELEEREDFDGPISASREEGGKEPCSYDARERVCSCKA